MVKQSERSRDREVSDAKKYLRKREERREEILDGMTIYPMWTSSPTRVILSIRARPCEPTRPEKSTSAPRKSRQRNARTHFFPKINTTKPKRTSARARTSSLFAALTIEDRRLLKLVDFFRVGNCAMRATDDNAEEELIYIVLKFLSLLYAIDLCDVNVA